MSNDFQRIESVVGIVIGRPLAWFVYVAWLAICWIVAWMIERARWLHGRWRRRMQAFGKLPVQAENRPQSWGRFF